MLRTGLCDYAGFIIAMVGSKMGLTGFLPILIAFSAELHRRVSFSQKRITGLTPLGRTPPTSEHACCAIMNAEQHFCPSNCILFGLRLDPGPCMGLGLGLT